MTEGENGTRAGKRRDAVANRQAVIDAAAELLPGNPGAGMQEIADFTGLGRSTVYRHFPNREALFDAMTHAMIEEGASSVEEILERSTDVRTTLYEIGVFTSEFTLRYRFLASLRTEERRPLDEAWHDLDLPFGVFLTQARTRGEIRDDLPVSWIRAQLGALNIGLLGDVLAGRIDGADAGPILGRTLVAMTEPRR